MLLPIFNGEYNDHSLYSQSHDNHISVYAYYMYIAFTVKQILIQNN